MIPACPPPVVDTQLQVGVRAFGQALGGLGVVHLDAQTYSLSLLIPTGMELFTVSGPPRTVAAGVAAWAPWLARMPIERDLRLVFTPTQEPRCDAGPGRIRQRLTETGWVRRWCGEGGHAKAVREGGLVQLYGAGYQLTFVVEDLP